MNALVLITDGRFPYLAHCLRSVQAFLDLDWFDRRIVVDDSGMGHDLQVPRFETITHPERRGLAAAVRSGWAACDGADHVFHLEEDFMFTGPVDLDAMRVTLLEHPQLAQLVLRRNAAVTEGPAGYIGDDPNAFTQRCQVIGDRYFRWLEHRKGFWLNPCLISGWAIRGGWPDTNEAGKTKQLAADPAIHMGIVGTHDDPPTVHHIGLERSADWKP